jgi:hypothetical protein
MKAQNVPGSAVRYAQYKSAIHAILDLLIENGKPLPAEEIAERIAEGGFRNGGEEALFAIRQSIRSFTHGLGRKAKQIKEVRLDRQGQLA